MKLNFKYNEKEFVTAMNQQAGDSKRQLVDFFISIFLLLGGIYLYSIGTNAIFSAFIIVISILFIFILLARRFIVPKVLFRREPKYKEEYILEFQEDQILFSAGDLSSSIPWRFYKEIKLSKDFIYLLHGKSGYAIIPKRIFESGEEMDEFIKLMHTKLQR